MSSTSLPSFATSDGFDRTRELFKLRGWAHVDKSGLMARIEERIMSNLFGGSDASLSEPVDMDSAQLFDVNIDLGNLESMDSTLLFEEGPSNTLYVDTDGHSDGTRTLVSTPCSVTDGCQALMQCPLGWDAGVMDS